MSPRFAKGLQIDALQGLGLHGAGVGARQRQQLVRQLLGIALEMFARSSGSHRFVVVLIEFFFNLQVRIRDPVAVWVASDHW